MKRLTERDPAWIDDELWESACEPNCEEVDAVYRKLKEYEDLEESLENIYGDCPDLLKVVVKTLKTYSAMDEKPIKSRLLTDEDVDKWLEYEKRLKGVNQ